MVRNRQSPPGKFTHAGFVVVLLIFLALAIGHSLVVPLTQGEDELAHYRYISFIAQTGRLPATPAERQQAWYRADWPPLYHLLVGWVVSPLDTSRPHLKDVGESPRRRLVGEIFYPRLIIYTEDANWPWQDGILAWHIGRFMSIVFAAGGLLFTYLTALELRRSAVFSPLLSHPSAPLLVTALLAFTPRFVFTSAMLGDDSLFILLSAAFIWLLLRALRGHNHWWLDATLGLLLGLSIATKYSTGLLPLALLPLAWVRAKHGWRWSRALGRLLVSWLFVLLGASWWFGWIGYHFNTVQRDGWFFGLLSPLLASGPDVSMRRVFSFFGGSDFSGPLRPGAVAEGSFAGWWAYLFHTFWGVPVLEHDPLWPWAYLLLLVFGLLALAGLWRAWRAADSAARLTLGVLALIVLLLLPFPVLRFFLTYNILETGQGRHILYPAAQAIPILLALGWLHIGVWANERVSGSASQRKSESMTQPATRNPQPASLLTPHSPLATRHSLHQHFAPAQVFAILPALILLLWSGWQLAYMARVYPAPLPVQTTTFSAASIPQPLKYRFTDQIEFLGYDFQPDPEQAIINLTLFWRALAPVNENYRVQVQLLNPAGRSHFTWLSHPLNGRYPSRAWDPGDVVRDVLPLPLAAVPANTYQIQLNLLHEADPDPVTAGPLSLIQFDLGRQQPIAGADSLGDWSYRLWLDDSPARARQTIALSFQNPTSNLENPKWALLGPDNRARSPVAVSDATAIFVIGPEWPGGDYRLTAPDGRSTDRPVLAVAAPERLFDLPPELVIRPGWTPINANFANQIELIGYALPQRRAEPGGGVPLTLAWRSLAPVQPDAVTFAVLLDAARQPFGSVDRYAAGFNSPMLWAIGEVVLDEFVLPVQPTAPPGVYAIHVGLYTKDGSLSYLPLVTDGQPTNTTAVVAGPVKIGGPPPGAVAANPQPQHAVNQTLGGQITLVGYDVSSQRVSESANGNSPNSPNSLTLKLYWRAESIPAADYTTFVHLRNTAGQTVAQKDQPPGGGRYPTSLWEPGEIIADEIDMPLPPDLPPGQYTPVVGLYDFTTGQRLAVPGNPANEIALEQ